MHIVVDLIMDALQCNMMTWKIFSLHNTRGVTWCLCDFSTQHKVMVMFTSIQTNRTSKWSWTSTSHSWVIMQCNGDVDQYTGSSDGQMTVLLTFSQMYRTWKRWWTRTTHSRVMVQGDGDYHVYCWIIDQCGDVEGLSQLVVNQW
jgi:hypothetical protein